MNDKVRSEIKDVARKLDLSILGAATQTADVDEIIRVGSAAGCATVCVNPCYVSYVAHNLPRGLTKTCSVIGYPFGQHSTAAKMAEARQAVEDGAEELDMVANIGFFKDGRDSEVGDEIARIEVDIEGFYMLMDKKLRDKAVRYLKSLGYTYITLDLEGYRTGSMNEVIGRVKYSP